MTARESLHKLIDQWPESDLEALEESLRAALRGGGLVMNETSFTDAEIEDEDMTAVRPISHDEFRRILDEAPFDDEPETEEEREALGESLASNREDRMSHEDVKKLIGL